MAGTPTLYGRGLYRGYVYGYAPTGLTYPTTHAILFHTTAIHLEWGWVTGASTCTIQVSTTPDFSGTLLINTTANGMRSHDFTDAGTNNTKRWWRWKSNDSGTVHDHWSEVGSYWVNTGFAESIWCPRNNWKMVDPDLVTDFYMLSAFPRYVIKAQNIWRVRERNRLGTMLSESVTFKSNIILGYDDSLYMDFEQFREIRRFNEEIKTLFLITLKDNEFQYPTPNVWKVQFDTDPELSMIASGRQDLMVGSISFMEV